MRSPLLLLAASAGCILAFTAARSSPAPTSDSPSSADVPIRQVVLFSSGVGYFQHEGTVHGDADTELRFKTGQINDILKSLVLQDLDGGRVGAVTYPSQDPLEKTLRSFQIDISGNPGLGDLLNQLRGAKVMVNTGTDGYEGAILGVEKKTVTKDKYDVAIERPFLNLITGSGMTSVALDDARKITLEDRALQEELDKALAALAAARDQDKKPVAIHFTGQGDRRVRMGYVVESPIWKASYRLLLGQGEGGKMDATLQGWAIIENQTDNDWNNVRLSLVSGRPISFIQDLYQPLYLPRPTVKPELYSSLKPQTYEGGEETASPINAPPESSVSSVMAAPAPAAMPRAFAVKRAITAQAMAGAYSDAIQADKSIASAASTAQIGELFQYTVGSVSLSRQRSAMIPIINDPIEAEKVSIYNERTLSKFALNGARLKNNTADKKALLQGPVSVYEDGGYAGDASLGDVPPGESRLLSYGVDLQLGVQPRALRNQSALLTGKIVEGVLMVSYKRLAAREYSAENKSDRSKKLIIEHPRNGDAWKLVDTAAPVETLPALYRFEITVPPGKVEKFTVREEATDSQRIELLSPSNLNNAVYYGDQNEIPPPVRAALTKAASLQQAVAETDRQMKEKQKQIDVIDAEQRRIRENLRTVGKGSAYGDRLLKKLDDQESQIERLRTDGEGLHDTLERQQGELTNYLKSLSVG